MTDDSATATGVLISCCNTGPRFGPYSLVYLRLEDRALFYVDIRTLPGAERWMGGITGMAVGPDAIYVAVQGVERGSTPYIAVFDLQLRFVREIRTPNARQTHGLRLTGSRLNIVSTGTNQIVAMDTSKDQDVEDILWSFEGGTTSDELHLNEYIELPGRRLALMHHSVDAPDAVGDGAVLDIDSGEILARGMTHPHTLLPYRDGVLVCDSLNGRILHVALGTTTCVFEDADRFFRGMCIVGDRLFVGCSARRIFSRKQGLSKRLSNAGTEAIGDPRYMADIYVIDLADFTLIEEIPFTEVGFEIYEMAPLVVAPAPAVLRAKPASLRAQSLRLRMTEFEVMAKDRGAVEAAPAKSKGDPEAVGRRLADRETRRQRREMRDARAGKKAVPSPT